MPYTARHAGQQLELCNYISHSVVNSARRHCVDKIMSFSRLLSRSILSRGAWSSHLLSARPALRAPYSASALTREVIQSRILDVLKGYEKVDQSKVVSLFKSHAYFLTFLLADSFVIFLQGSWLGQPRCG